MKQKIFDNVSLNIKSKYLVETYELLIGNNMQPLSVSHHILQLNCTQLHTTSKRHHCYSVCQLDEFSSLDFDPDILIPPRISPQSLRKETGTTIAMLVCQLNLFEALKSVKCLLKYLATLTVSLVFKVRMANFSVYQIN